MFASIRNVNPMQRQFGDPNSLRMGFRQYNGICFLDQKTISVHCSRKQGKNAAVPPPTFFPLLALLRYYIHQDRRNIGPWGLVPPIFGPISIRRGRFCPPDRLVPTKFLTFQRLWYIELDSAKS